MHFNRNSLGGKSNFGWGVNKPGSRSPSAIVSACPNDKLGIADGNCSATWHASLPNLSSALDNGRLTTGAFSKRYLSLTALALIEDRLLLLKHQRHSNLRFFEQNVRAGWKAALITIMLFRWPTVPVLLSGSVSDVARPPSSHQIASFG
jgi:hypothetical protein